MLLLVHRYFYAVRGEDVDACVHVPALPRADLFDAEANGGQPRSASHLHHVVVRYLSDATGATTAGPGAADHTRFVPALPTGSLLFSWSSFHILSQSQLC